MSVPNSVPRFVLEGVIGAVEISTANTARDGSGALGTLLGGGQQGTLIDMLRVVAKGTTTAGMIRFFLFDGSTFYLYDELAVTAIIPSGTVAAFEGEIIPTKPLVIPAGFTILVSTNNNEFFEVFAFGGNY